MKFIRSEDFNLNEISTLSSKAMQECLGYFEHSYLQKMIAAQTVINQYTKTINDDQKRFELIVDEYYSWICKSFFCCNLSISA